MGKKMNRIDKAALTGWAIVIDMAGLVAVVYLLAWGVAMIIQSIPVVFWQVAWAMVKGAVPFAIAIVIAVWINQKINGKG